MSGDQEGDTLGEKTNIIWRGESFFDDIHRRACVFKVRALIYFVITLDFSVKLLSTNLVHCVGHRRNLDPARQDRQNLVLGICCMGYVDQRETDTKASIV